MKKGAISSDVLLLITAAIWGFAFTAQRLGMDHIGPFLYTGIRFLLGALVLLPLLAARKKPPNDAERKEPPRRQILRIGAVAGFFLFFGVTFQQIGLQYTTAGKAGFITGLYVILVPILGIIWRQRSHGGTWAGAGLAVVGLYFLSVTEGFRIGSGDLLVLAGAFFWAFHVHIIGKFAKTLDSVKLAIFQYVFCGIISLIVAIIIEPVEMAAILKAALPIAYGGIASVGIAYTLQVIAQKTAPPAHAAIIMSLEGVFAVIGGYLFLAEVLAFRGIFGCSLMLLGMLISQVAVTRAAKKDKVEIAISSAE
ncbi:MAG: DMT family transporter [Spirochaetales bacterium]|jgi:drug/metabolite transporter (DMT)-like permease|nr:DMT family transporter [Spirochaetales bacterium]